MVHKVEHELMYFTTNDPVLEMPRMSCDNCRHQEKQGETLICNLWPEQGEATGPPPEYGACNTFYPNKHAIQLMVEFMHMNEWNLWSVEGHETPKLENFYYEKGEDDEGD